MPSILTIDRLNQILAGIKSNVAEYPISIEKGGTGVNTIENLREEITGFDKTFVVPSPYDETFEYKPSIVVVDGMTPGSLLSSCIVGVRSLRRNTSWNWVTSIGCGNAPNAEIGSSVLVGSVCCPNATRISGTIAIGNYAATYQKSRLDSSVLIGHTVASGLKTDSDQIISSSVIIGSNTGSRIKHSALSIFLGNSGGEVSEATNSFVSGFSSATGCDKLSNTIVIGDTCLKLSGTTGRSATNSVIMGYQALYSGITLSTISNVISIGYNSKITGNNQFQLGGSGVTPYAHAALQVRSDERDKANITDLDYDYKMFISKLKPRNFQWDYREDYIPEPTRDADGNIIDENTMAFDQIVHDGSHVRSRRHNGFIAQEVKQVMDDMNFDFAGYQDHSVNGGMDVLSLGYEEFIAPMVACIQDLMKENQELRNELKAIKDHLKI